MCFFNTSPLFPFPLLGGSFNPCFNGCASSIISVRLVFTIPLCFNPCFNGCASSMRSTLHALKARGGFNPCFNGCASSILVCITIYARILLVSILVLMDVLLQYSFYFTFTNNPYVSILVLMDVLLQYDFPHFEIKED